MPSIPNFTYPEVKGEKSINDGFNSQENCHSMEIFGSEYHTKKVKPKQSPININSDRTTECHLLCKLDMKYKPSKCHLERTAQGIIKLKWDPGSYITYNNMNYELKHIQFHTPSQHQIDNNSSEMEINLYHYNLDDDNYLYMTDAEIHGLKETQVEEKLEEVKSKVENENHPLDSKKTQRLKENGTRGVIISILVNHVEDESDRGETKASKGNMFLSQFVHNRKFLDLKKKNSSQTKREHLTTDIEVSKDWNIKDLLPQKKSYYAYEGSIPFPPCTENFQWIVFDHHLEIIQEFINIIKNEGNPLGFRDIHPLNNRVVFYNNNIQTQQTVNQDDTDEQIQTKKEMVKRVLEPIRIKVDNRAGYEYRVKAQKIINDYSQGSTKNHLQNDAGGKAALKSISRQWDDLGKIGYQEVSAKDIIEDYIDGYDLTKEGEGKDFLENIVFDKNIYDGDYLRNYLNIHGFSIKGNKIEKIDSGTPIEIEIQKLMEYVRGYYDDEATNTLFITNFKTLTYAGFQTSWDTWFTAKDSEMKAKLVNLKLGVIYLLLEWDISLNKSEIRIIDKIGDIDIYYQFMLDFWKEFFTEFKGKDEEILKNMYFKSRSDDLNTTINNYNCQTWGSNEVHHESSYGLLKKNALNPQGYTETQLEDHPDKFQIKKMIRDGLLEWNGSKYVPHNKCRNPNNSKSAPWCYTTESKVRWDYCMKPDITFKSRKYILVVIFVFIIFLSYYMVTLIFRFQLFQKFMAALTGAKLEEGSGTGGTE